MEKAGTTAAESIMVGDTLDADIEGAVNAGIDSVYYNPAVPAEGKIKPTYVIGKLSELKNIL
jgi:putative hydrolase of the HAD superfamily